MVMLEDASSCCYRSVSLIVNNLHGESKRTDSLCVFVFTAWLYCACHGGSACACHRVCWHVSVRSLLQSLCFRIQKMLEVYRPDWCETREDWSVFLFSPQNKWVSLHLCLHFVFIKSVLTSALSGRATRNMDCFVANVSTTTRTGCWASPGKDYARVLIATFQITKGYFLHSALLLEIQKQALGGKCDTIGNSFNSALTCSDVVLQSVEEGFE